VFDGRAVGSGGGNTTASSDSTLVYSQPDSPVQWVSSTQLVIDVPPGAGAGVPLVVLLRTGTVAVGSMSYEPPRVSFVRPGYLMYGETRPRVVCGTGFGGGVAVDSKLMFGGIGCDMDSIRHVSLDDAA